MNGKNISKILNGSIGKNMKENKNFEDLKILAPNSYQSLWVFFSWEAPDYVLKRYLKRGRDLCNSIACKGSCEMLDKNEIIKVYGKKVIVFS